MHFQLAASFGAPVPEKLVRPPALEIPATPNADLLQRRQFEGAINPAAAGPARRALIPIRMVIERNQDERPVQPAEPERGQMVEIAGTIDDEGRQLRTNLAIKFLDQPARRGKTQTRSP